MDDMVRAYDWPSNGDMIADVARLGYLDGSVFDATYGEGNFWSKFQPEWLVTNDLHKDADFHWDYRRIARPDKCYDTVVFDPPYKLNGTPAMESMDERYGTGNRTSREEVLGDILAGTIECFRICRKYLLVKCMDQVEGGKMRWQTHMVTTVVELLGGRLVDRFDLLQVPRPQPGDRGQKTARANYSSLLVFGR